MWRDIRKLIHQHENFLLTTHINPDGDGLGATCALTELLLQMGKKVRFVCDGPIPQKFAFLDCHSTYETYQSPGDYDDIQVMIVLDAHRRERIGGVSELIDRSDLISICIDHHEVLTEPLTPYLWIDPKACSVGAMIYSLYKESGFVLNMRAATGIYVSIVCDTGRFSYPSTCQKAHKIADECIRLGVNPDLIYTRLFQRVSFAEIKMFVCALQGMETYLNNRVVVQYLRQEDCLSDIESIDLGYIHDFNNLIEDVQCFVLLRELADHRIRVSLRSRSDLDISSVMHHLGGGGHPQAAGVYWHGSLEEAKRKILELLKNLFEKQAELESAIKT